jgi:hypothetical protein
MKEGGIRRLLKPSENSVAKGQAAQPASVNQEVEYFRKKGARMHYDQYRRAGLFIGSGVVEAGCRNVIGQRLKKSGMFWSEAGAQSVIDLRCALLGGHFDEDWDRLFTPKADREVTFPSCTLSLAAIGSFVYFLVMWARKWPAWIAWLSRLVLE